MTDEGSAPPAAAPAPEPAPVAVPETAPVPEVVTTPAPTQPEPVPTTPEPVISEEAVKEISAEITEAVKDVVMQEAQPLPRHTSSPAGEARDPASASSASGLATGAQPSLTPSPTPPSPASQPKVSARNRMLTVVRQRKAERLEKIVALAHERKVITNDDVEKLLKVSDATATNYLRALINEGRLTRIGHDGGARYQISKG